MRTVKILNSTVGNRKKFKSVKEAELYITENDVEPIARNSYVTLESTTVTRKKIQIEKAGLSNDRKQYILSNIINELKLEIPASSLHNSFMGHFLSKYLNRKYPIIEYGGVDKKAMYDSFYKTIKSKLGVTDSDFDEVQKIMIDRSKTDESCPYLIWIDSSRFPDYAIYDNCNLVIKTKSVDEDKLHRDCVLNYLQSIDAKTIKCFYTKTNYTDCNVLYGISIGHNHFCMRSSGIVLYEKLYGRNVSMTGEYDITNKYFDDVFGKI